ncbi:MAG: coiled-coil domain-containing protein [Burkholderiales bacterium]
MATVAFDTHKFVKDLTASGVPDAQAEAFVRAQQEVLAQALDSTLTTKTDIADLRIGIDKEFAIIRTEIAVLKWMLGVVIAATAIPLLKPLFN